MQLLKHGGAVLGILFLVFLFYRVYDIGGDRREKHVRNEWKLAEAAETLEVERQRQEDQATADAINARKMAEREEILKRNMNANFQKRLRDERAKAAYNALIPADGVQLYNEAIRGAGQH